MDIENAGAQFLEMSDLHYSLWTHGVAYTEPHQSRRRMRVGDGVGQEHGWRQIWIPDTVRFLGSAR